MADLLDLTETAISAAVALLVKQGWLYVEQPRVDGHKGVNHYFPQFDRVAEVLTAAGFNVGKNGHSEASKVRSDDEQGPVSQGSKVRFNEVSTSGKPDANPETEPSEKNPEKEPSTPKGAVSPSGFSQEEWFPTFWEHYPHKIGEVDAAKAFAEVVKDDGVLFEAIMNGVCAYHEYLDASGSYPMAPATWLQKKRWTDKPAPVKPKEKPKGPSGQRYAI